MKCFPLYLVRKCLILAAALMALINLLCMWKVSVQIEKEKEKKPEAKLVRKLEKINHSYLTKPWRHSEATTATGQQSTSYGQPNTVPRKQEDKSSASLVYHISFRETKISKDNNRIKQSKASAQWTTKQVHSQTPQADEDSLDRTFKDYIKLDNFKAVNKHDFEAPVSTQAFRTEKEAMTACEQLDEKQCQAILKPKDNTSCFTLGSEFILLSDDDSTIFVKMEFLASLEFYVSDVKCAASTTKIQRSNSSREVGCRLPDIDPFDASSTRYFLPIVPLACEREATLFTTYRDGFLEVVVNHDRGAPITNLSFQTIHREADGSDTGFRLGNRRPLKYKGPVLKLNHDFVQVNAEFSNGVKQTDFHAQVVPKNHVLRRVPQRRAGISLNIIILALDQTSHATFQRLVSSSYKFLQDELQAFIFNGFSLVGEGTTPQLTALLTGRSLEENCKSHEARTGFKGAGTVDQWPFIFKTLKEYGYSTMFSEDAPPIGAFNMRLKGFSKPPCDHYARPFWSAVPHKLNAGVLHEKCINSQPQHKIQLEYLRSLFRAYPKTPKFGFTFLSSLCHHDTILPLGAAEKDFYEFFKSMRDLGFLNDTMLIVMGDHGARTGEFRSTMQGKLEERLPLLSIALPDSFWLKYPKLIKNFKSNTDVIMSPLDLHATFMHLLKYPLDPSQTELTRGISLFSKLPRNRTCQDAKIPEYFCPCVQWLPLNITHAHVRIGAQIATDHINSLLKKDPKVSRLCEQLTIDAILSAWLEIPSTKVQTFNGIQNGDGLGIGEPEFKNLSKPTECNYQVKFRTTPGFAVFEASVKLIEGRFTVSEHISRINLYGSQPDCIKNSHPHLREFCYCRHDTW